MQAIGTGLTVTLTERFRRLDADTLLYEYTVDDPTIFTRPFTVAAPMRTTSRCSSTPVTRGTTAC